MKIKDKTISAEQAIKMLARQKKDWPLVQTNYKALEEIQTRSLDLESFQIRIQFNPARAVSSGAKIDARSIQERPCFLCTKHLPDKQERIIFDNNYWLLCNPYPIFPHHFTIPSLIHQPQRILPCISDFLRLTKLLAPLTLFYNGPKSGASAPDHLHFQAVTHGIMPMDKEVIQRVKTTLHSSGESLVIPLTNYLRNGFIISAITQQETLQLFHNVYSLLPILPGEEEPRMNLFGTFIEDRWIITLIPRKLHRPWQYEAEDENHLLSSPGAADIGGLFITPLEKDFNKINSALLKDVYQQVCYSDLEIKDFFVHLSSN